MTIHIVEFAIPFKVGERAQYHKEGVEVTITNMMIQSDGDLYRVFYDCKDYTGKQYTLEAYKLWRELKTDRGSKPEAFDKQHSNSWGNEGELRV